MSVVPDAVPVRAAAAPPEAEVLVIGSGPAGVAAAAALVEAGISVVMIDGGGPGVSPLPQGRFAEIRARDPEQWRLFVGEDFHALRGGGASTPKLRAPTNRGVFDGFAEAYGLRTENFVAVGSLSAGGLSNVWGSGVACFDGRDLAGFPLEPGDLARSYRAVAERVGVSGSLQAGDDMAAFFGTDHAVQPAPEPNENARRLLARYGKRGRRDGFSLGRARNAVLTRDHAGRQGCARCGLCLWGCARRSVYSALHDLEALQARPNFHYAGGIHIERVVPRGKADGSCRAEGRRLADRAPVAFRGRRLLLACGAIGSGRLVHDALGRRGRPIPLLTTPAVGFALWLPERFGAAAEAEAFGLAQLSFRLSEPEAADDYVFGNIFGTDGLLASELARHVPLSRPAAVRLVRRLMPSLMVANLFMASDYTEHRFTLRPDGGIDIVGGYREDLFRARLGRLRARLAGAFRRCGALLLPGSFKPTLPGADVHYAGTVPMRAAPRPEEAWPDGEVAGLPGIHVVDAALFPRLPAKPHTFTMMANADRIGRLLAREARAGTERRRA